MCGRYSLTTPSEGLRALFDFIEQPNLAPRYNIAPTQEVAAVRLEEDGKRHFRWLKWGLVPSWAKDLSIGSRMINARSETLAEKPAFRSAFKQRRCLILADGFYEWRVEGKGPKQPYRITLADGGPFAFAGLWERWRDKKSGESVDSCTIATTLANDALESIHHRMPVILPPADYGMWLDTTESSDRVQALLRPAPNDQIRFHAISTRVNKVANDDATVIEPIDPDGTAHAHPRQGQLF